MSYIITPICGESFAPPIHNLCLHLHTGRGPVEDDTVASTALLWVLPPGPEQRHVYPHMSEEEVHWWNMVAPRLRSRRCDHHGGKG